MELIIFGQKIKVSKKNLKSQGMYGLYYPVKKEIEIDKTLKGDEFNQTLIHEIIHSVFHRLGFINTNLSSEMEELICDNIATAIIENCKITWKNKKVKIES